MKKFWIAILAVGLFMAFTVPAFAVSGSDLTFSGQYRVRGWYDDNVSHLKAGEVGNPTVNQGEAFYDNRLRVETTFKIAEGLKLVTRFDALEKMWGRDTYGNTDGAKANGNIYFERAYVSFTTGLGTLNVGYQDWSRFGTQFIDSDETFPGIKYINTFGPLTFLAGTQKRSETRATQGSPTVTGNQNYNSGYMDIDSDLYLAGFIFKFKGGEAGFLYEFLNDRSASQLPTQVATAPSRLTVHVFDGYAKVKIGPVYVEAEGVLLSGTAADYSKLSNTKNVSIDNPYGLYLNAEVDLKPAYVGFKAVYTTGDDFNTTDKKEGGLFSVLGLGTDHDFALMIGNYEYFNQVTANGAVGGKGWMVGNMGGVVCVNYSMDNLVAWQIYGGIKPTPKLDLRLAFTDAYVQTDPLNFGAANTWKNRHLGSEIDLRASYKIFDNLTYSIGAAYFFTGEYFKGVESTSFAVADDYLLMHQLMLSF